jgi:hypothetical protein
LRRTFLLFKFQFLYIFSFKGFIFLQKMFIFHILKLFAVTEVMYVKIEDISTIKIVFKEPKLAFQ